MKVDLKVSSDSLMKLNERLRRLPNKIHSKMLKTSMRKAWKPIVPMARAAAPVGRAGARRYKQKQFFRGRLANSFGVRVVGLRVTGGRVIRARIISRAPYAWLVEHGHYAPRPYHKGSPSSTWVSGQEYLKPAFEKHKTAAVGILTREISAELDRHFAGGGS